MVLLFIYLCAPRQSPGVSNTNRLSPTQVSQDLPFLHPSETSVLNRLSKLGSDYIRFTEFIEQHTGHVHQQVSPPPVSQGPGSWDLGPGTWALQPGSLLNNFLNVSLHKTLFLKSRICSSGTSHEPVEPDRTSWNLLAGFLHRPGLHAAAVQTGPAGPGTRGKVTTQPTGGHREACDWMLI